MKEKSKDLLKNSFGSLVSNDRALAAAKTSPLWLTIIIFILGVLLPLVPITTAYASVSGAAGVNTNSYGLKNTVSHFALEMYKDDKTLVLNENKELPFNNDNSETPIYTYTNQLSGLKELMVFTAPFDSKEKTTALVNGKEKTVKKQEKFVNDVYENNKELVSEDDIGNKSYSMPSFVVYFKDTFAFYTFKRGTDTAGISFSGDYKSFPEGTDVLRYLVADEKNPIAKPASSDEIKTTLATKSEVEDTIFNNFKRFLNVSYRNAKDRATLYSTLIFGGIYLGLSLIMAGIIWLLTRGKNNPFNYMSILTTFKIESWICLAPALIGLIFGLILPLQMSIKMMLFIAPLGFRVMFLLTKQLRPM